MLAARRRALLRPRRASSIRTRIKTYIVDIAGFEPATLAEHLPLEQGLRPPVRCPEEENLASRRASSIRTRIKTLFFLLGLCYFVVLAEHLPLEQGLRPPNTVTVLRLFDGLAEHLPLEQGLRTQEEGNCTGYAKSRRASSIRTRIKTSLPRAGPLQAALLAEHLPLEQGCRGERLGRIIRGDCCVNSLLLLVYVLL